MDALTITSCDATAVPREAGPPAPARAVSCGGLSAAILKEPAEITAIAAQWRALEARVTQPVFFQSHAWCSHVLRNGAGDPAQDGIAPRIVCVHQAGELVGLWPLRLMHQMGARLLTDLSDPYGQYADALIAPEADAAAVFQSMLAVIRQAGETDGLLLHKVRADAALAPFLAHHGKRAGDSERAPFIRLADHTSFEAFHLTVNPKTRKNLRNNRNRLARVGEVMHEVVVDPATRRQVINRAFDLRLELLEDRGHTSRAYNDPAFRNFVAALADDASGDLELLVMALSLQGRDLAIQWGFVHNGRYYAYVAARSTFHEDASPGRLHLAHVLATCMARGIAVADLLAPAAPYKLSWTSDATPIADWTLALTWRGRMVLDLWDKRLRPTARAVLLNLPLAVRRPLVRLMRRTG